MEVISRVKIAEYEENGWMVTKYRTELENGIVGIGTNRHPILTKEEKIAKEKSMGRTYIRIKKRIEERNHEEERA